MIYSLGRRMNTEKLYRVTVLEELGADLICIHARIWSLLMYFPRHLVGRTVTSVQLKNY
jgi:hypothetical protein